ncbi:MAG: hydrogenase maturation protease [Bacteroidales bacterium]
MPDKLKELLSGSARILFVGIGNVLRMDDGAGVYISNHIRKEGKISALTVEVSIENYIGKINSLNPDVLVLIDCVDFGSAPGNSSLLALSEIKSITYNTHNISLRTLTDFFSMPVYVLGIQPEKVEFGEKLSYLVRTEADNLISIINSH